MLPFLRNTLTVLRGAVLGQGIVFLALPWLSRLYGPQAFGTLQSLQALLSVLLIMCSLRLEIAVLSADESELPHVLAACVGLCLVSSILTGLGLAALAALWPALLAPLGPAVWLLPASLLVAGLGQILTYVGLRRHAFDINATGKIAQSISYVAAAGLLGATWPGALALNLADLVGRLALVMASWRGALRRAMREHARLGRTTLFVLRRFRGLPMFSMPSAVINTLGSSFTTVMMLALFNSNEAGNYALVERLLGAPIAIIAGAASQAFMAALSGPGLPVGERRALFRRIVRSSALAGLAPMVLIVVAGPVLVPWLLGPEWELAGQFARVLAPMLYISAVATPVNMTLVVCGRQHWQFLWDSAKLAVVALMWWRVGDGGHNSMSAVLAYSAIASCFYLLHIVLSYRCLDLDGGEPCTKPTA